MLIKISAFSNIEKQKNELLAYFQQWKANEEQMDDVTIVGINMN